MSKVKVKTNKVSGFRIAVMIISLLLLSFIMAFSMLLGISSFKRNAPVVIGEDATTVRKALPSDGTLPTKSTPLDNIGYMAYVLDHQPSYNVYAKNETTSTGYKQTTQSWKDYKNAELSGAGYGVMVASDLSYSALVKSSTQSCFIGDNEAHIRSGNKPGANSTPSDIEWSKSAPSIYDKKGYKYVYGEFSTEISVYVINEQTFNGADEVVDNGDGTYSQKYYLNENAACWYQYGMKTRGSLKTFPKFKRIEISFTFDSKWQILSSHCEERATINPRALGGMDMESNSVTDVTYDYAAEGFDNGHFDYFEKYFKEHVGKKPGDQKEPPKEPDVFEILGSGFSKVVGESGQQFNVALTIGDTEYDGKIFLHLPNMGDILGSLDARVALEKKGSGKQDLYIEFKNGAVNVYYSTDFAMVVNIDDISQSVGDIISWVKGLTQPVALHELETQEEKSGLDVGSLLNALTKEVTDTEAFIFLQSDNLLGLGIGVDVKMDFDRTIEEDGGNIFSIKSVDLNYIGYNGTTVALTAAITPDDGEVITRNAADNPANLADYATSVYKLLSSNTVKVDINLADTLIKGLNLNAVSYLSIGSNIAASAEIEAEYNGISLKLDANYVYDKTGYGKIYLHISEINGEKVDAKVYCDIKDTVNTVKDIIELFTGKNDGGDEDQKPSKSVNLAEIINKVLKLDFSKIIGKVSGDNNSVSLEIGVDELLAGLDISLGMNFGTLALTLDREPACLSGELPALGLGVAVSGADNELPAIDKNSFIDINSYLKSVYSLLTKPSYDISVSFAGAKLNDNLDLSDLKVDGVATVAMGNGAIRVKLPATVKYGDYGVAFTAYYTVNLSDGSYGKIYLNLTEINGKEVDAKVYCDIKNVVDGVKDLISKFTSVNAVSVQAEEVKEVSLLSKAVETLLKLDYNEVITATNESLTVKLNVDEILSGLDISLGGIAFGELNLEFTVETGSLCGTLEDLGLTVEVNGNEEALAEFATEGHVDLSTYLDSINALISKKSYNLELSFVGNDFVSTDIDLTGLKLDVNAQVALSEGFNGITVNISNLRVEYKEISIALSARYEVSFDGSYGTVYLNVTELFGNEIDAKVKADISEAVNSVNNIINAFKAPAVQTYAETSDIVANIINGVLKLDFNELLNATNEKATVKLNLDTLLSEFNLGLNLGTVTLEYVPAQFELSGSDSAIGLNLIRIIGSDDELGLFSSDGYIDVNAFLGGIEELVNSNVYEIGLNFVGSEIAGIDLSGLTLNATAYASIENGYNNITVNVPMLISYCGLEVELNVYYSADINGNDFSTVYIELTRIDRTNLSVKVYCDIKDAISTVKEIINSFSQPGASTQSDSADIISKVVGVVLNLDYANIIKCTQEKLSVTLDVDEILSELDISLAGVSFGELQLDLTLTDGVASLSGKLEKLGVKMSLKGNDAYEMKVPVESDYLDLTAVLNLVKDMIDEGKKIADAKDIAFTVNGAATIDGVKVAVNGKGEVVWGDELKVAVSLSLTVDGEKLDINFVYDKDGDPFVILTINGTGVKIHNAEIDKLVNSIKDLIDAFKKDPAPETGEPAAQSVEVGGYSLEEILKNGNVKKVLNAVLGFANEFAVEIRSNPGNVYNLLINHVGGATVTLGADGCLSLDLSKGDNKLFASVEAGNKSTVDSILGTLNEEGEYEYLELSKFVKKLYDGLFNKIESVSLKKYLGDNPYEVVLDLIGANSGISAIEGVKVNVKLYYDEGVVGTKFETKLMHAVLDLTINGTHVIASVSYHGRTLFVELNKIGGTTFTGIAFKTEVENIFNAAEQLVRLITDTNLVEIVTRFTGNGAASSSDIKNLALFAEQKDENGNSAPSILTNLIDALLSLNLEQSFKFDKDTNTATINIDGISEAVLNIKLGTITATVGEKTLNANVKLENSAAWLTLSAAPCERKTEVIDPDKYTDIGFVSTLLSDLVGTVTNGDQIKKIYDLYTFTGSIAVDIKDIPVLGSINLRFNNATLTTGFENDKFYVSLAASMQKTNVLWYTVTANRDISITYSDGLIVLGRDIGTNKEMYKVVTFEYLLDNLLDRTNSPIRWLLGTSDDAWKIICDNVKLNIDSGLTKPKTYTLYEKLQQNVKEGEFALSDYLSCLFVKANGEELSSYGDASLAVEKFGLEDNFYAFDINVKELTGGTLSALCAAILRNEGGLSGIKAYGAVGSMVNFTVDFGTYREGVTETYGGLVLKETTVSADAFYNEFVEAENVTEASFNGGKTYYKYDGATDDYVPVEAYEEGVMYFEKVNTLYYVEDTDGNFVLAKEFESGKTYYKYADSDKKLGGNVAIRNYLNYLTDDKKYKFDRNTPFEVTETHKANHVTPIFGCYDSETNTYISSDVLETIYLDVYASKDALKPERTLEVLYGSTVKLVSDFPEFAGDNKTEKLIYENKAGKNLYNSIIITVDELARKNLAIENGRVIIYKNSVTAVEVVFKFVDIDGGMADESHAFVVGDSLAEYVLNDYSFLGWYKEESFKTLVEEVTESDIVDGKMTVYGKYIKTVYEKDGVIYSFDNKLEDGRGGYFVSGVVKGEKSEFNKYRGNADLWLEILDRINGYPVKYIAAKAFANADNSVETSLVNVLVPSTVEAVYENAFLDNKGLKKVAFCADRIFIAGSANSSNKTSVFYGCYSGNNPSNNNDFTVYYNGTHAKDPYSATEIKIDSQWHRIYFNKELVGQTVYTMRTQLGGWSYAKFETEVINLDGSNTLPASVNLSKIIYNGIHFTAYGEAGNLANEIDAELQSQLKKNIYSVTATSALKLDGKIYPIKITITEHVEIKPVTALDVEVIFFDGVNNNVVAQATNVEVASNDNLVDFYKNNVTYTTKSNYGLVGLYKDAQFSELAPKTNDGTVTKLYAKVVLKEVTGDNGVKYQFVEATETVLAHYAVSGFDAAKGAKYTQNDAWLIIENTVYDFPVTEVMNDALKGKNIKNVVVPENVVKVGTLAFGSNENMLNAVFLAKSVHFEGSMSGNNYAFFESCSSANAQSTLLSVYYTVITYYSNDGKDDNPGWAYFHSAGNNKPRFIGNPDPDAVDGGKRYDSGWSFTQYVINTDGIDLSKYSYLKNLEVFENGINITVASEEDIKTEVISKINGLTAENVSFINGFKVEVSFDTSNARHNLVNVKVINDFDNAMYAVTVTTSNSVVNAYVKDLTDSLYAVVGEYYEIVPIDGYEIKSVTGVEAVPIEGSDNWKFMMPAKVTEITVTCKKKPFTEVTLYSEISFTMDGTNYDTSLTVNAQEGSAMVGAPTAIVTESTEYVFIGWAYKATETSWLFEGNTVNYNVYYAIWAIVGDGINGVSKQDAAVQLSDIKATTTENYTFIGWAFENDGNLQFETTVTTYQHIYKAVWVKNRDEIEKTSITLSGSTLSATVTENAHSIYGWYSNEEFGDTLVATCADNSAMLCLAKDVTVLHARIQYTLTVAVSGTSCRDVIIEQTDKIDGISVNETKKSASAGSNKSLSIDTELLVLENDIIRITDLKATSKDFRIQLWHNGGYEYTTGQINIKTRQGTSTKAAVIHAYNSNGIINVDKVDDNFAGQLFSEDITINGNLTITFQN